MAVAIDIAGRKVGPGCPCFIIAEAGVNHNGDLDLAHQLIDVAAGTGADAVKFQTYKADRLVTPSAAKAEYQITATGCQESQHQMLSRLELSWNDHRRLFDHAQRRGILFMSTPFDEDSANSLRDLGVAVYKLPSGELTNWAFLAHTARLGRPIILSTGMASLGEVEAAVQAIQIAGSTELVLLHCVSNYPANPTDCNLRAMHTLRMAFDLPVGYSDHTLGIDIALAAVALGACVIEKHFTLDCSLPGPDHRASAEPAELRALVEGIHRVEAALGNGKKQAAATEADTAATARKSLVAAQDIPAGSILTPEAITARRPGTGLSPALRSCLVGRTAKITIPAGTLLKLDMLV